MGFINRNKMKILPIGIQTFEKLRNNNSLYIDKTRQIYELISNGSMYFLSRPRRFGKSLLLSTIKELFKGNKSIFNGLYIYDKWDWDKSYPIVHLDFSVMAYSTTEELKLSLNKFMELVATDNNIVMDNELALPMKFSQLIKRLREKVGNQVVILVDEYDKPLLDNLNNKKMYPEIKRTLHDFYQVIKAEDANERFVFLTGVSRFAGLSIFSGLNNLNDITLNHKYLTICGYTQEELEDNFKEYIGDTSKYLKISYDKTIDMIRHWYNGYSWDGKTFVYNPFSTLLFFDNKEPKSYWFKTGTPTFLIDQIRKKNDLVTFVSNQKTNSNSLEGNASDDIEMITLLFQTGYLTIKKREQKEDNTIQYSLDFPNMEVRKAFLNSLIKEYSHKELVEVDEINRNIAKALEEKDPNNLQKCLTELFANIPYDLTTEKESYYHSLFLLTMRLCGFEVEGEIHTDKGRIDALLKKDNNIVVIEIKYGKEKSTKKMVKKAMDQIKKKKYYEKYGWNNNVSLLAIAFGNNNKIACSFKSLDS